MIRLGSTDIANMPGIAKVMWGADQIWPSAVGSDELVAISFDGVCITYGNDTGLGYAWVVPEGYRRCTGVNFDGNCWFETDIYLQGSDTLRFAFKATKACNVLGCYTDTSAQNNYSVYASTTSGAKYLRYNGGTYLSAISTNTRYDIEITPTGATGFGSASTWTQQTFTASSKMIIGTTSRTATSAKLTGVLYGDVEVEGRGYYVPLEKISDSSIVYYDVVSGNMYANLGSGTPTALGYV